MMVSLPPAAIAALGEAMSPRATTTYLPWPSLDADAYHGPAGEYALAAKPFTEADPIGVLVSTLSISGAMIGRGPHLTAGNDRHPANIWPVLVGKTAARKGTAYAVALAATNYADPTFSGDPKRGGRILGGWGSGEALVDALRDPDGDHGGADDKRLLVVEREYARLLRVAGRDGSTISMHLRDGWDGQPLESRTRGSGIVVATGHHLVVTGHITPDELKARLSDTDAVNGWANRFLWVLVRRCGRHPEGGNVPDELATDFGRQLREAVTAARSRGAMRRTAAAEVRWAEVYGYMADDEPDGMLGAIIGRAEAQCLRLSLLYALLDSSPAVEVAHVDAAWALWSYARASAERVWGDRLGDPIADRLLAALDSAGGRLTGDEQHHALGRHTSADQLGHARQVLVRTGLAQVLTETTRGRPREVLVRSERSETSEKRLTNCSHRPLLSHSSLLSHSPDEASPPTDEDVARWEAEREAS